MNITYCSHKAICSHLLSLNSSTVPGTLKELMSAENSHIQISMPTTFDEETSHYFKDTVHIFNIYLHNNINK